MHGLCAHAVAAVLAWVRTGTDADEPDLFEVLRMQDPDWLATRLAELAAADPALAERLLAQAGDRQALKDVAGLRAELDEVLDELEDEASSPGLYDEWYPDGEALDELLDEAAEFVPDAPDAVRELADHVITRTERLLNFENCYGKGITQALESQREGDRADGRVSRPVRRLLAAVRPPARRGQLAAGYPARHGQQRRPGLSLASDGGRSLVTGFRPSQQITFSPLTSTADSGAHWATGNVVAGLADVPDALAAAPGSGDLIALLPGRVELSRPGGSGRTTLARVGSVTDSAAGRARGPSGLTAVAFGPAGVPMAAGACAKAGTVGIFAFVGRHWQAAGPALPASLSGQLVTVLCLTTVGGQAEALASHRSLLTVWATGPASSGWAREQAINVPIQYSSSSLDRPPGRPMTWGCGICCRPAGRWTGSPSEGRQATKPPRLQATAMNAIGAQLQNPAITDTVHNGINQLARWPCDT